MHFSIFMHVNFNLSFTFCSEPDINTSRNLDQICYHLVFLWDLGINIPYLGSDITHIEDKNEVF